MIKKLSSSLVLSLFAFVTYGQTIVSTSPENKNVVLEEFTGIHCVYCPEGHVIAQTIINNNPGDAFVINVHTGSFATPGTGEPDFRTPYGTAIAGQTGLVGYPAATVNRQNFPGKEQGASGTTAMNRNNWTSAANIALAQSSASNVGIEAVIDVQASTLTVHVEVYYTANSSEATNLLNVALLQNDTKGPQTGGGQGSNYNHMHRLVELITGQWGEAINTTTAGTFVDRTYTYPIPADYNGVPVEFADLEVVAFISETHQEIPTGNSALPTYTGITNNNDASVVEILEILPTCTTEIGPDVTIQNLGSDPITSLDIEYIVNGQAHTYNWTGNITALRKETITLPAVPYTLTGSNSIEVTVPSDDDNSNNSQSIAFDEAIGGTGSVALEIITDGYGSECRWNLKDINGTTIASGGPYGNNQTINLNFSLDADCYVFSALDTYGDGGTRFTLTDHEGTQLFRVIGNWGSSSIGNFSSDGVLGIGDFSSENISLYPNPASTILNLKNAENANIQVFDVLGKLILSQENIAMDAQINVANLANGTYFMKISKDNSVATKRFLISK